MSTNVELIAVQTWESRFRGTLRHVEIMLSALGIWYLIQIFGLVSIINVAVPEEIQQDIPQAKVYRSK